MMLTFLAFSLICFFEKHRPPEASGDKSRAFGEIRYDILVYLQFPTKNTGFEIVHFENAEGI